MIIRNKIIPSAWIVYSFWYLLLYAVAAALRRAQLWWVVTDYPASLAVVGAGAGIGLLLTLGVRAATMHKREIEVAGGHSHRGALLTLGELPTPPALAAGEESNVNEYVGRLHARFWWPRVASEFPAHAAALEAVMRSMTAQPLLPASPVPGGHGDRTLIEHSLGVADMIVHRGHAWRYTGQRDKRGQVRVRVQDTQRGYHAFGRKDVGLLALAGFAHDLGKLTCYRKAGERRAPFRTVPVTEAVPNHDIEGAKLLRKIPEVMALPYPDRRALLLACGFYHHPAAIPLGGGITDRMRSLVELLIEADVATGVVEGSKEKAQVPSEATSAQPSGETTPVQTPATAVGAMAVRTAPPVVVAPSPQPSNGGAAKPPVTTAQDPPPAPPAPTNSLDEVELMLRALSDASAIGSRVPDRTKRVAYRCGDSLLVVDAALRAQVSHMGGVSEGYAFRTLEVTSGNATPFTTALLEKLAERGWLERGYQDTVLAPARSLFIADVKKFRKPVSGVFVLPARAIPSAMQAMDDGEFKLVRPLWGGHSGSKRRQQEEHTDTPAQESGDTPAREGNDTAISAAPVAPSKPSAPDGSRARAEQCGLALVEMFSELKRTHVNGADFVSVTQDSEAGRMVADFLRATSEAGHAGDSKWVVKTADGKYMLPVGRAQPVAIATEDQAGMDVTP